MGKGRIAFVFLQIISICSSLPLSTKSRWIVDDSSGQRVKLACVNWPSHLEPMIAEGVEKKPLSEIARKITASGFNCVRFTWATHMFTRPEYRNLKVSESLDKYNLSAARDGIVRNNPHILNMTVVELHKAVVDELGRNKLMVVLDNHIGRPGWCCRDPDFNPWEWEWERGLLTVAKAYLGNPAVSLINSHYFTTIKTRIVLKVVGMSLRNEPRGSRQNELKLRWQPRFPQIPTARCYVPFSNKFKLVYQGHWYPFGIPTDQICASVTKATTHNLLFLTQGNNPFPLFFE